MTSSLASPARRPVLVAYADRHGVAASAFLADGTLSLIYDAAYRVEVRPHLEGRLVLESFLLDLSLLPETRQGEALVSLLRDAAITVRDHACGLVLDETRSRLLLQQVLPAPVDLRRLETELGDFVNVLAFFQGLCVDPTRRLRA